MKRFVALEHVVKASCKLQILLLMKQYLKKYKAVQNYTKLQAIQKYMTQYKTEYYGTFYFMHEQASKLYFENYFTC